MKNETRLWADATTGAESGMDMVVSLVSLVLLVLLSWKSLGLCTIKGKGRREGATTNVVLVLVLVVGSVAVILHVACILFMQCWAFDVGRHRTVLLTSMKESTLLMRSGTERMIIVNFSVENEFPRKCRVMTCRNEKHVGWRRKTNTWEHTNKDKQSNNNENDRNKDDNHTHNHHDDVDQHRNDDELPRRWASADPVTLPP